MRNRTNTVEPVRLQTWTQTSFVDDMKRQVILPAVRQSDYKKGEPPPK